MSGHSKWATTKHKKAINDAKRSNLFTKLIKNIEVAARTGGADPSANPTLYDAIKTAKKSSVPNSNIDRAVKRGSGAEAGGVHYEQIQYEGYGPHGVAILVECLTDNKNRAASDVRSTFGKNGGALADQGAVSYMFKRKGTIIVPEQANDKLITEDSILDAIMNFEVDDIEKVDDLFNITTSAKDLISVRTALQDAGIDYDSAEVSFVPTVHTEIDKQGFVSVTKLIDALEDLDDVQNVYSNFDYKE
jgi:YebC/PmpR family DNA-binding regulatory protein